LGRELASELEQQARVLGDPVVTEYVNRIGQNLVRNSDAKVAFTIKVIDDDEINALALPGGYFYVNSGLILAADNEAELAGVMAHEIAHVCARHATRNMTKGQIWNMVSLPLIFVGGGAGYAIRQVVAVSVPMSLLKFSRDAEREADLLGLEYEYATGYDPLAFVQFFERIHARERQEKHRLLSKMFSTHPMTEDRIRRAQEEMATMLPVREQYVVSTSEFDEVKSRLAAATSRMRKERNERNADRPTLHRRTSQSGGSGNDGSSSTAADRDDHDDQRPTLKRRSD
jgi:predicted Zn-dependent protease